MKQLFQTVWWWARISVLIVVALYAIALLAFNANQRADVWYWPNRPAENTSVIALVLASFIAGGLICTIGWALFSAWVNLRRTRELRRRRAAEERKAELQRKAAMLRTKPPVQPTVRQPKPDLLAGPAAVIEPLKHEPSARQVIPARGEQPAEPAKPAARAEPVLKPDPQPKPEPGKAVEPVALPVVADAPASASAGAKPQAPAEPISVEAHRATPFASSPISPAATAATTAAPKQAAASKPTGPDIIDPPAPSADER